MQEPRDDGLFLSLPLFRAADAVSGGRRGRARATRRGAQGRAGRKTRAKPGQRPCASAAAVHTAAARGRKGRTADRAEALSGCLRVRVCMCVRACVCVVEREREERRRERERLRFAFRRSESLSSFRLLSLSPFPSLSLSLFLSHFLHISSRALSAHPVAGVSHRNTSAALSCVSRKALLSPSHSLPLSAAALCRRSCGFSLSLPLSPLRPFVCAVEKREE